MSRERHKNPFEGAYDTSSTPALMGGVVLHNLLWLGGAGLAFVAGGDLAIQLVQQDHSQTIVDGAATLLFSGLVRVEQWLIEEQSSVLQSRAMAIPANHDT
jgi:hypothetical protein